MNLIHCKARLPRICRSLLVAALACGVFAASDFRLAADEAAEPKETVLLAGDSLRGWRIADKFWFDKHGTVEAKDGQVTLGAGQPGTGISYEGKLPREDYELTLEARRLAGDDFFCGLTFPVGDSHCTLILGGWGGSVTGLSNVDDFAAVENNTTGSFDFRKDRWYAIRLQVSKESIAAWVDETQLVDQPRKDHRFGVWWEQEPMRPLGIAAWNTRAAVRNVRLKRLAR